MHAEGCYLIFDCPGQVELFTLHDALLKILKVMTDDWHLRWGQLPCAAAAETQWQGAQQFSCRRNFIRSTGSERLPTSSNFNWSRAERSNDIGLNLPVCGLLLPLCCLPGWRRCT